MNKNEGFGALILDCAEKPTFSTSHHQPAPPAESWDLPFVFSFRAPLGLSINHCWLSTHQLGMARFLLLRSACWCCCCCLLASWPEIYMEDGVVICGALNGNTNRSSQLSAGRACRWCEVEKMRVSPHRPKLGLQNPHFYS